MEVKRTLDDYVDQWMTQLDRDLAQAEVPIPKRVLTNALTFAEYAVTAVSTGEKGSPFAEAWFKPVYKATEQWYRNRYGSAVDAPSDNSLIGVVVLFGASFQVTVPRTLTKVEEVGETAWLIFPADVQEGENVQQWVKLAPNLGSLPQAEAESFLANVTRVGGELRSIYVDLMTAKIPDIQSDGLRESILAHLAASSDHILKGRPANLDLACWEAHQAVEKSLKLLCRQQTGKHRPIHELATIFRDLTDKTGVSLQLCKALPRQAEIIAIRSHERTDTTLLKTIGIYNEALKATASYAAAMQRDLSIRNARFLLKAPHYNR